MKTSDKKILQSRKRKLILKLARNAPKSLAGQTHNLDYEMAGRSQGLAHGGTAALIELARATGLAGMIDTHLPLLKEHRPYTESDHILSLAAGVVAGGQCPEFLRAMRQNTQLTQSLGLQRVPDSTTSCDFLRRFSGNNVRELMGLIIKTTVHVLKALLPAEERKLGIIDGDGTIVPTGAECIDGIEYCAYKKQWGYHPLLISLANTGQPLCIVNRPGNASSADQSCEYFDMAAIPMLEVYDRLLFRGDTDFSQCSYLDCWDETGKIDFVFGHDAGQPLVAEAEALGEDKWKLLSKQTRLVRTRPRTKPERIKPQLVMKHEFITMETVREDVAEFSWKPTACTRAYRMAAVRKQIQVTQGQLQLEPQTRYFFYITNLWNEPAEKIVDHGHKRCNQENLIAQLAGQVHALAPPSNTLESNWAWMVIASLAWTLKSWFGLLSKDEQMRQRIVRMEWRTFRSLFVEIPAQLLRTGRRTVLRILGGHLPSLEPFLLIWDQIRRLKQIRC